MQINENLIKRLNKKTQLEKSNGTNIYFSNIGNATYLGYVANNNATLNIDDWKKYRYIYVLAGYGGYFFPSIYPTSYILASKTIKLAYLTNKYGGYDNGWFQYQDETHLYVNGQSGVDTSAYFYAII